MWRIVAGLLASLAATVAAAAAVGTAAAEPCHDGDVVAARDADLQVLAGARCLRGSLTLTRDVARLAPLATLAWIEGDLRVVRTDRLRSLRGLDALARVGGDVQIGGPKQGTPGLRDVDGLRALVEIGGDVDAGCLNRNPRLAEATVRRFLTRAAVRGRVWFVAANTPHRPDAHPCE